LNASPKNFKNRAVGRTPKRSPPRENRRTRPTLIQKQERKNKIMAKEKTNHPESKTPAPVGLTIEVIDGVEWVTLTHDIDGKPYLPENQPKAIKELWEHGVKHYNLKTERLKLLKRETEEKGELTRLYGKYSNHFKKSENDPTLKIYSVGGLVIDATITETVAIKTEKDAPPPISAAAQESADQVAALTKNKTTGGKKGAKAKTPADVF
jgi:hypothetical protein